MREEFATCCDCGLDEYAEAVFCRKCHGENLAAREHNTRRKTIEACIEAISYSATDANGLYVTPLERLKAMLNEGTADE